MSSNNAVIAHSLMKIKSPKIFKQHTDIYVCLPLTLLVLIDVATASGALSARFWVSHVEHCKSIAGDV